MRKGLFLIAGLVAFAPVRATARPCVGVFVRDACMVGSGNGQPCVYPKKKGEKADIVDRDPVDGVKAVGLYRLGSYPARDVKLAPWCKLD